LILSILTAMLYNCRVNDQWSGCGKTINRPHKVLG